jgi:hypothetical protein
MCYNLCCFVAEEKGAVVLPPPPARLPRHRPPHSNGCHPERSEGSRLVRPIAPSTPRLLPRSALSVQNYANNPLFFNLLQTAVVATRLFSHSYKLPRGALPAPSQPLLHFSTDETFSPHSNPRNPNAFYSLQTNSCTPGGGVPRHSPLVTSSHVSTWSSNCPTARCASRIEYR